MQTKTEQWATIRATDVPDRYDLWSGDVPLLEGATMTEIAHFLRHGHSECGPDCPNAGC